MFIDLREIARKGKTEQSFYFEYSPTQELISIPNVNLLGTIKITGKITLDKNHCAYLDMDLSYVLKGECTRCGSICEREYQTDFSEYLSPQNEFGYSVVNDWVDLIKIINDVVLTDQPINFLCSDNCKGFCIGCGVNLNDGECKCKK